MASQEKGNIFNKALDVGLQELGFGWVVLYYMTWFPVSLM